MATVRNPGTAEALAAAEQLAVQGDQIPFVW
jgi:hypothetical protein